ncbi:MAG: AmpG family muropeptide MFS transporter [Pseudobdellovibrio sp.]
MSNLIKALRNPRLFIVFVMGFSSGLPFLLVGGTLKAYLTESGVDLKTIGFFSLVSLPYTWKFIWSPIMDRYVPFKLGRRRSWLLIAQAGCMAALVALSFVDPVLNLTVLAVSAVIVSFFSASQDIAIDAYRREILTDEELGLGSSLAILGYRLAMLLAGAGALLMADHISWPTVYLVMAAVMLIGAFTTWLAPEPKLDVPLPQSLRESIVNPLKEFFQRPNAWIILAFVLLYKIGESMASDMLNPFFLKIGFTKTEIAGVSKVFGFWAVILGGIVGGTLIYRLKLYRSLWLFGILQSLCILLFSFLAQLGANLSMLAVAVGAENFTSGMASAAYVAFMASQTNKRFTATQYALLTSLMGVPRVFFGATTGILAENLGWSQYFMACTVFTIPGLLILFKLRNLINNPQAPPA